MSHSAAVAGEKRFHLFCRTFTRSKLGKKKRKNERVASLQYDIPILCENIHGQLAV